jgi:hypothetical protein
VVAERMNNSSEKLVRLPTFDGSRRTSNCGGPDLLHMQ